MLKKNIMITFVVIVLLAAGFFLAYNFWPKAEAPEPNGENNATSTLPNATSTEPNATISQPSFYSWLQEETAPTIKYSHIDKITSIPLELVVNSSPLVQGDAAKKVSNIGYGDFDNDNSQEAAFNLTSSPSGVSGLTFIYKLVKKNDIDKELVNLAIDRSFSQDLQEGYQGHLGFVVFNNLLIESFPLYKAEDANCCPSGGVRYILYKWDSQNKKLAVDKTVALEKQWFDRVKSNEITFGDVLNEALNRFGL